ncbi:AbiH family protein [Flavobacterium davisii]|uniref:AbiH family protein n=1 Tax=Flavobacterium davisii TaxID=2906077 RepID=UPI0035CEC9AA
MNIVHIIGNGFDLNLGLKTSYKHFYEYYKKQESKNDNIKLLKKEIDTNTENWSDLELALGKFTSEITTVEEFEIIRQDIILNLSNYLKSIESSFDLSNVNTHELSIFLSSPHIELRNGDKAIFEELLISLKHEMSSINIISFNYTSILDNLIQNFVDKTMSFAKAISSNSTIKPVKHIHGLLDERLIIGVNDNSQVSNENFTKEIDFNEAFIKTEYNKASGHLVDDECVDLINNANIICVFGSSLGLTDMFWWELICNKLLKQNCKLIIYHKSFNVEGALFDNLITKEIRILKEKFLSNKSNLTNEEKEIIRQNIYVNVNSNFFNILN